jgi:hypothetical protein
VLTWHGFSLVTGWEQRRVQQAFRAAASDRVLMVQREIAQTLGVVQDIGSFFDASAQVGRREFRKFVGPALKRYESIEALQWIPRISETERASFEQDARRSFARFRMTEIDRAGELVDAATRPLHFPVLYVQPYQHNKQALGLDLAADPAVLGELQITREAGMCPRLGKNTSSTYTPPENARRTTDHAINPARSLWNIRSLPGPYASRTDNGRHGASLSRATSNPTPGVAGRPLRADCRSRLC